MHTPLLQDIGLSPNEAKIYDTLLALGETSVGAIATKANIHRRNVYDVLHRLMEKGLVSQIFQKGENRFRAVHPNKLLELLSEKTRQLEHALPELSTLYEATPLSEAAYIYRGVEGFKNYMRDLVRVGQDTYFLGAKGLWFSPHVDQKFLADFQRESKRKNIRYYTLYDHRVLKQLPEAIKKVGGEYKILPPQYSTAGVLDIFGDHVVTFTSVDVGNFGEDGTIFVMVNAKLAESYKTWFQFMWDLCPNVLKKTGPAKNYQRIKSTPFSDSRESENGV